MISIPADMVTSVPPAIAISRLFSCKRSSVFNQYHFIAGDTVMVAVLLPKKLQVAVTSSLSPAVAGTL
jgi:hypothetical protein